jgi:hypothetical protein
MTTLCHLKLAKRGTVTFLREPTPATNVIMSAGRTLVNFTRTGQPDAMQPDISRMHSFEGRRLKVIAVMTATS